MIAESEISHPWFATPLGQRYLAEEQRVADALWAKVPGMELLQVGEWGHPGALLEKARLPNRLTVVQGKQPANGMVVDPAALPFSSDSMDAVVLPHTLESAAQPHQVLREAARVLSEQGHLLIFGFNPFSFFGAPRLLGWRGYPLGGQLLGMRRLRDWLSLLGFRIQSTAGCFYRPPLNRAGLLDRLEFMERLGPNWLPLPPGGYAILAHKQIPGMMPLSALVKNEKKIIGGMAEPAARRMH